MAVKQGLSEKNKHSVLTTVLRKDRSIGHYFSHTSVACSRMHAVSLVSTMLGWVFEMFCLRTILRQNLAERERQRERQREKETDRQTDREKSEENVE